MPSANYARITATDSQLLDGARELFTIEARNAGEHLVEQSGRG